ENILQVLVALEHLLDTAGRLEVLVAEDPRVQDAGGGGQRVHRRIDAELNDLAREHGGGVQVGEGGGGRGVGDVVGGHVDGLNRSDGAALGGGDPLLERSHLGAE